MKKMRVSVGIVLMALSSLAFGQSVVSDPLNPGVNQCGVLLDAVAETKIAVTALPAPATDIICKFNISTLPAGVHTIKMTAIINDPVFGVKESLPSLPLVFTVPTTPSVPSGLRLIP